MTAITTKPLFEDDDEWFPHDCRFRGGKGGGKGFGKGKGGGSGKGFGGDPGPSGADVRTEMFPMFEEPLDSLRKKSAWERKRKVPQKGQSHPPPKKY